MPCKASNIKQRTDGRLARWLCLDPRSSPLLLSNHVPEFQRPGQTDHRHATNRRRRCPQFSSRWMLAPLYPRQTHATGRTLQGGSTTVFSYDGPRNLHFDGTVIQLRKSLLLSPSDSIPPTSNEPDADDPTVGFQEYITSRLIHVEFLPHVQVERAWSEETVSTHHEKRPAKGREKDRIDVDRTRAELPLVS